MLLIHKFCPKLRSESERKRWQRRRRRRLQDGSTAGSRTLRVPYMREKSWLTENNVPSAKSLGEDTSGS